MPTHARGQKFKVGIHLGGVGKGSGRCLGARVSVCVWGGCGGSHGVQHVEAGKLQGVGPYAWM